MPRSSLYKGWYWDKTNSRLEFYYDNVKVGHITGTTFVLAAGVGVTITDTGLTVTAGGALITAGGLTVTAGGLTVTAGGLAVTADGLTIADGGLVVRGGSRIREGLGLADITDASNQTYTAAAIVGGLITRDPNGGARTDTTPTGTQIETELNAQGIDVATGDTFKCHLINTANGAEAITLAPDSGVTISNVGQTLAQNESAVLLFRRTGSNTFVLYILGA